MTLTRFVARMLLAALLLIGSVVPASAAVTIVFWSHELGNSFPHAFITMSGVPDAGGAPVDVNLGFTARKVSPALLFGPVPGMYDVADPPYMRSSNAQFSVVLTDAQYAAVLKLIDEWGEKGDQTYDLNKRNCVTFVREAARRAGLSGVDVIGLMKKPRSYLHAVAAANPARVTIIDKQGRDYLPTLQPAALPAVVAAPNGVAAPTIAAAPATPAATPVATAPPAVLQPAG